MKCLHCLLDKTMWNKQFGWLVTKSKVHVVYLQPAEGKCVVPITWHLFVTITRQLISSNCLFCGNSDKNYGEQDGYELVLVWIFNFQSMPTMSWRDAIKGMTNGPLVSMQELNIFKTSMPRCMFTIFATTTKIGHQFMPGVGMKRKSLKAGLSPRTQRVGVW